MSTVDEAVASAAERLDTARLTGVPCDPVRALLPPGDLAAAYAVQTVLGERRRAEGRRITGWKIGLTSAAVQTQLGVDTPDFGRLTDDMAVPDGAEIPWGTVLQARAEAEVAVVLEHDLTHERHTVADVIRATAFVLPAVEIVGSRIRDWDITAVDTIADNASSGAYVLGTRPVTLRELDLRTALHGAGAARRTCVHRRGSRLSGPSVARRPVAGRHARTPRPPAEGRGHRAHRRTRPHDDRRAR